jgi:hypothetical protein
VIGDDHPDYATRDGKNGSPETARSAAMYSARYSTKMEKLKEGSEEGEEEGDEQSRFADWKGRRRARTHTWLGLDAQRSPVDLWRTHWTNAMRSDYQPDDARMALALRHMHSTKAFIDIAVESHAARDTQTMQRAQEDAAREAWHAAIAIGMWPDADLDPVELEWLHGETRKRFESMNIADPLPPVPLREERESVYGERYTAFAGAIGVTERFRLSGRPSRAELYEAAEAVGVAVDRPRAKLRRQHVLYSLEAAGIPVTWRLKKLSLAQLQEHSELLGVTVYVPTVAPRSGTAMKALKEAGFGFSKRPDGSLVGFDLSGEILLHNEHRWIIADSEKAAELLEAATAGERQEKAAYQERVRESAAQHEESMKPFRNACAERGISFGMTMSDAEKELFYEVWEEVRKRDQLSVSPNDPSNGPCGPSLGDEGPPE